MPPVTIAKSRAPPVARRSSSTAWLLKLATASARKTLTA